MNSQNKIKWEKDSWEDFKDDTVWLRFWVLWEIRRKWGWANHFYKQLDRCNGEIVATEFWSIAAGKRYLFLCLWISILRASFEGLVKGPKSKGEKANIHIREVLGELPLLIKNRKKLTNDTARIFRNAVFHCQWHPLQKEYRLSQEQTNEFEDLHIEMGKWLEAEFNESSKTFFEKYEKPQPWLFGDDGKDTLSIFDF